MTSKRKALEALRKMSSDAKLYDHSSGGAWLSEWLVHLVAPRGMIWSNALVHSRRVHSFKATGGKEQFWNQVIGEINCLGEPKQCNADICSKWKIDTNACEFWAD